MTKTLLYAAAMAAMFASCKKKDATPETETLVELKYANLSVEENKKKIEQSGINLTNQLNSLPDEKFIDVIESLIDLDDKSTSSISPLTTMANITVAAKHKDLNGILSAVSNTSANEPYKLSRYFGVFTWDKNTKEWKKTSNNSKLEISFPATKTTATNNAVLTATYIASGTSVIIDGETFELPSSVTTTLTVDGKKELEVTSTYAYKSDGSPTLADVKLTLGAFGMTVKVTNDNKTASYSYSFTKGALTLISAKGTGFGNATISKIENADDVDGLLDSASAIVDVMDLQFVTNANVKAIVSELNKTSNLSDEQYAKKEAELYNKYANAYALYKGDNTMIAKLAFESVKSSYSYWDYWYNNMWNSTPKEVFYSYYNVEPRLIFKDGSKLSFETFGENGFSKLIDQLEELAEKFDR